MPELPRVLIQLDTDPTPSSFDAIVAIDSGVDHLLQYGGVEPTSAIGLIHGAMFTRSPKQLRNTAIFIGGSNVQAGECIGAETKRTFFGPIRTSVMLDGNGSNTTAAAAVLCAVRHQKLAGTNALVLGGTGPVGRRIATLLLGQAANVSLASRSASRAADVCKQIQAHFPQPMAGDLTPITVDDENSLQHALADKQIVISCGAAGVQLLNSAALAKAIDLRVAIDLNAVPPAGVEGIDVTDNAVVRGVRTDYGAIGTGGLKMKIHHAAIRKLFTRNDLYLDAKEIFEIGLQLESSR